LNFVEYYYYYHYSILL